MPLAADEAHVWFGRIDRCTVARESDLDECERARADRIRFRVQRSRFIMRRWLLRSVLSHYCGAQPSSISFVYGEDGKPALGNDSQIANLKFSTSSCGPFAMYSVTAGREVGVDMERVRAFDGMSDFVARFFSVHENRAFLSANGDAQVQLFYEIWTAKEAYLKGKGEGFSRDLHTTSIVPSTDGGSRVRIFSGGAWVSVPWTMSLFEPEKGLVACLAIQTSEKRDCSPQ